MCIMICKTTLQILVYLMIWKLEPEVLLLPDQLLIDFANIFRWGSGEPQTDPIADFNAEDKLDSDGKDSKRTGQILWIRGLTRLQTQVCLRTVVGLICFSAPAFLKSIFKTNCDLRWLYVYVTR